MKVRSLTFSRATAEGLSADRPQSPKRWKPTIWTLEFDGVRMLVKDVSRGSRLFRYTLGRWNLRREARICARLDDLDFAPKCFGWLDRDAIVLEWLDAEPISRPKAAELDAGFFDEMQKNVNAMHERGIVHLDLRHRTNVLVGADDQPRLIDFENALYLGTNFLSRRLLVPLLAWIDHSAVLKRRVRYFPDSVSEKQTKKDRFYRRVRRLWPFGRVWPLRPFGE